MRNSIVSDNANVDFEIEDDVEDAPLVAVSGVVNKQKESSLFHSVQKAVRNVFLYVLLLVILVGIIASIRQLTSDFSVKNDEKTQTDGAVVTPVTIKPLNHSELTPNDGAVGTSKPLNYSESTPKNEKVQPTTPSSKVTEIFNLTRFRMEVLKDPNSFFTSGKKRNWMNKNKTYGVVGCSQIRLDGMRIREHVVWNILAGLDHIYYFDTSHEGEPNMKEVLQPFIDSGFVTYSTRVFSGRFESDCYSNYGRSSEWMVLFDSDEYIVVPSGMSIYELMKKHFADRDGLVLWWKILVPFMSNIKSSPFLYPELNSLNYGDKICEINTKKGALGKMIVKLDPNVTFTFPFGPHWACSNQFDCPGGRLSTSKRCISDENGIYDYNYCSSSIGDAVYYLNNRWVNTYEKIFLTHLYYKSMEELLLKAGRGTFGVADYGSFNYIDHFVIVYREFCGDGNEETKVTSSESQPTISLLRKLVDLVLSVLPAIPCDHLPRNLLLKRGFPNIPKDPMFNFFVDKVKQRLEFDVEWYIKHVKYEVLAGKNNSWHLSPLLHFIEVNRYASLATLTNNSMWIPVSPLTNLTKCL